MKKLRYWTLGLAILVLGLFVNAPAARADFGDALLGAAVGAGIYAAVDDDDDDRVNRRQYVAPYGYRSYGDSYLGSGARVYGYRTSPTGLPFGAAYYIDEGDYRNYRDANGNYLGRERIRW